MPSDPTVFPNIHPLVLRAIDDIASTARTTEAIRADPDQEDYDLVTLRIRSFLEGGAEPEPTGLYRWGKTAVAPYPQDAIIALENANSHIFESYMLTTEYLQTAVSMIVHGLLKDHRLDPVANAEHRQFVEETRTSIMKDIVSLVAQRHPGPSRLNPASLLDGEEPDGGGNAADSETNVAPFPPGPGPQEPGAA